MGDRLFHHPRAFDHLRQKHLAGAEQIADDLHAGHQRTFDDGERGGIFLPGFLDVLFDVIDDALDQRVRQTRFDASRSARRRR